MDYFVRNESGAEFQVPREQYDYLKTKKRYVCWTSADVSKIQAGVYRKYPVKQGGPWYELSDGTRVKGKANAQREQAKL